VHNDQCYHKDSSHFRDLPIRPDKLDAMTPTEARALLVEAILPYVDERKLSII